MDGDIKFNVGANTAQFDAGMSRVANSARTAGDKIKQAFSGLGGILVGGAALAGLKSLMDGLDRVAKMATRFGTSAESIQRVSLAADLAGTSIDVVAQSMQKASIAASKATIEGGTMAETFQRAGINAQEFNKAQLDQKLLMVARAFEAARGNADKTNAIIEILGSRAAGQLIPLISNVQALEEEMANAAVASDAMVSEIEKANDRMTRFGNTIKVAFAGGLEALNNFSERLGDVLAGGSGQTIAEMEAAEMRANAEARLRNRGELLPDDSTTRTVERFVGGPAPATVEESVPGPNAEENVRRINAELAVMRSELEAAKVPTAGITDELDEQVSKTEERKNQQRELKKLALEIREAEAAGNQALAEDLREYEALVKAAIEYEGDLEMAARDVNAAHKERLRLQEQALQKSIAQVQKEVELAETMAFGTDEAKKKAEWMKVYSDIMEKTGRDDLARRAANAETFEKSETSSAGGPGSGSMGSFGSGGRNSRSSMRDLAARGDEDARTAMFRAENEAARYQDRINNMLSENKFRSAAQAMGRMDRARERREDTFRGLQNLRDQGLGNNFGEGYRNFRDMFGMDADQLIKERLGEDYDPTRSPERNFERMAKDFERPEAERLQEDAKQSQGRKQKDNTGPGSPQDNSTKLDKIINIMEERLPIRVLAKAS